MKRLWRLAWGVSLTVALTNSPALAASYRSALAHGVESRDRAEETGNPQDWADALDAFVEAVELEPTKEAHFELANAASHLHFDDEACESYEAALQLGLEGKAAEVGRSFIALHRDGLATLQISGPVGAVVRVRVRRRGRLPVHALLVTAGVVQIQVDAPGYQAWATELELGPNETKQVQAAMLPLVPAHRVEAGSQPDHRAPRAAPNAKPNSRAWGPPVVIAGGALAGLGAAGVAISSALLPSARHTLESRCVVLDGDECLQTTAGQRSAAQNAANRIKTLSAVRWVALGAGALGLGTFAVGLVKTMRPARADIYVSANRLDLQFTADF